MDHVITTPSIDIIIPCLNEENYIGKTLESIQTNFGNCENVTVVDNGSSDSTLEIAQAFGAHIVVKEKSTIAGLRNMGASMSDGNILLFIDADVSLSDNWLKVFLKLYPKLPSNRLWITGSRCKSPFNDFINLYWYQILNQKNSGYINSGHLIVSREMFNKAKGFDESLITSEDHDFCVRTSENGGQIIHNPRLIAFHFGYPNSIFEFIKREFWHGKTDFSSLKKYLKSKTAIISSLLSILYLTSIFLGLITKTFHPILLSFLIGYLISLTLVIYKFGATKKRNLLLTTLIQQLYFIARSLSIISLK